MKRILMGYDGSPGAEATLKDLDRAGLPAEAEARLLTLADVWLPPDPEKSEPAFPDRVPQTRYAARQHALDALKAARSIARDGAERLQGMFPKWKVLALAHADSPAWGILAEARKSNSDLIVVGSHGRTMLQRFFLGSVSQKVAAEAACSVRIYRPHERSSGAPSIMVAVDGSSDSTAALDEVASREWPPGTVIHVTTVLDPKLRSIPASVFAQEWGAGGEGTEWVEQMLQGLAEKLRGRGFTAETHNLEGDPKSVLLEQAEKWGAETVFLGARGLQHGSRLYLGTLASAIATRAPCSVEIVRPASQAVK